MSVAFSCPLRYHLSGQVSNTAPRALQQQGGAGRGVWAQPSQALQSSEKALEATSAFKTDSLRT